MTAPAGTAAVCVVGRTDFHSGMGTVTAAACEALARNFPVVLLPTRDFAASAGRDVQLPSGRRIPVVTSSEGYPVVLYADVLWNGAFDFNHRLVPDAGALRVAHIPYDSDELPPEWVDILNDRFDAVLFSSAHLEQVARTSGVRCAVGTLPIALELERLLAAPYRRPAPGTTVIGSLSAFHDRKNLEPLVEAFVAAYGSDESVRLRLHSNLAIGGVYERVTALARTAPAQNVEITHGNLSVAERDALLNSFDGYVNCSSGEGYSIGPREALALGKPAALSDIGAHADLQGLPGVVPITPAGRMPARYAEIDNRVFGAQSIVTAEAIGAALVELVDYCRSAELVPDAPVRRRRAAEFTLRTLTPAYERLVDPDSASVRPRVPASPFTRLDEVAPLARAASGRHARRARPRGRLVVPLHDGGFFSIFNTYMTHLVWGLRDERVGMVLPHWDVTPLLERFDGRLTSYCYSNPGDGNMWLKLFEPLYDLTAAEMDDAAFLADGAFHPTDLHNAAREPLLTHINAFELYRRPWFPRFRQQYHGVLSDHVRLRPELRAELDGRLERFRDDRLVVAVHVKHPSHAIEQPGLVMANHQTYVREVEAVVRERGVALGSDDWRVFVATDQERVVDLFRQTFGEHVIVFDDVDRVEAATDEEFDRLDRDEQLREVHQLQHLRAADDSQRSWRLAWEVWRDAEAMAASDALLHVVSNVSTAVSYLGTGVEMRYLAP